MKRALFFLAALCIFCNTIVFAGETPINVIYIHGANQDRTGGAKGFEESASKMHKDLIKNFNKSQFIKDSLLKDAYINEKAQTLYWADRLKVNKDYIEDSLAKAKKTSTAVHQYARILIGEQVHDAVWLQKNKNMVPIIRELHKKVMANYAKGEKTILVGFSAGSFVTVDYMLVKSRILNIPEMLTHSKGKWGITDKDVELAKKYVQNNACMASAINSKFLYVDDFENIYLNSDSAQRENAIKNIDKESNLSCAPDDAILGVINFGSPYVVFYSEVSDENSLQHYVARKTIRKIVENNKFYLTVNYSQDPIAMPLPDYTFEQLTQGKYLNDIKNGNGFMYDTIVRGGSYSLNPHFNYWNTTNKYTKAVAKSYEKGYRYFYNK